MTLLIWQIGALLGFGWLLLGLAWVNDSRSGFWQYFTAILLLATVVGLVWKIAELLW